MRDLPDEAIGSLVRELREGIRPLEARAEYTEIVSEFEVFCQDYGIKYHIKSDTLRFIGRSPKLTMETT